MAPNGFLSCRVGDSLTAPFYWSYITSLKQQETEHACKERQDLQRKWQEFKDSMPKTIDGMDGSHMS
jgi:hypothetical protein